MTEWITTAVVPLPPGWRNRYIGDLTGIVEDACPGMLHQRSDDGTRVVFAAPDALGFEVVAAESSSPTYIGTVGPLGHTDNESSLAEYVRRRFCEIGVDDGGPDKTRAELIAAELRNLREAVT